MAVAFPPCNVKIAARQAYDCPRASEALAGCRHKRSAGGGAASAGQTGSALPNFERDVLSRGDMGKRYISAFGKNGVIFEQGTDLGQIIGLDVIDPKDHMGIAHID